LLWNFSVTATLPPSTSTPPMLILLDAMEQAEFQPAVSNRIIYRLYLHWHSECTLIRRGRRCQIWRWSVDEVGEDGKSRAGRWEVKKSRGARRSTPQTRGFADGLRNPGEPSRAFTFTSKVSPSCPGGQLAPTPTLSSPNKGRICLFACLSVVPDFSLTWCGHC